MFVEKSRMEIVKDPADFRKLELEVLKLNPVPVFDLILDDDTFVPGVVALDDRALGILVGGHTGLIAFADVPAVANRTVRRALRVSGIYKSPFFGWWLRRRRAERAGALAGSPSWIPTI